MESFTSYWYEIQRTVLITLTASVTFSIQVPQLLSFQTIHLGASNAGLEETQTSLHLFIDGG